MIQKIQLRKDTMPTWNEAYKKQNLKAPFFTFEWHEVWFRILGSGWEPFPLLINNTVVAPLARKGSLVEFSGGREVADYLDLIGPDEAKLDAWKEIVPFLKSSGINGLTLFNIPESSGTLQFFGDKTEKEDVTPIVHLPDSWEKYLTQLPKKYRHEVLRKLRKFERELPGFEIVKSQKPSDDIDTLVELMKRDTQKRIFLTDAVIAFFHQILRLFEKDVVLMLLKNSETVAGALLAFQIQQSLLLYNSGFNKDFPGAGFYLKAKGIQHAIEDGIKEYNFLQGSERYKYELGGKDFTVYTIRIIV